MSVYPTCFILFFFSFPRRYNTSRSQCVCVGIRRYWVTFFSFSKFSNSIIYINVLCFVESSPSLEYECGVFCVWLDFFSSSWLCVYIVCLVGCGDKKTEKRNKNWKIKKDYGTDFIFLLLVSGVVIVIHMLLSDFLVHRQNVPGVMPKFLKKKPILFFLDAVRCICT